MPSGNPKGSHSRSGILGRRGHREPEIYGDRNLGGSQIGGRAQSHAAVNLVLTDGGSRQIGRVIDQAVTAIDHKDR